MSYVYLLKHAELPLVKIGLSKAPLSRSKQIGSEAFNMASSCIIKTASESCARRLERVLHLLHDADRQKDSRVPFSGATEWFSSFVYDQALTFIQREANAFGVLGIEAAVGEQKPPQNQRVILRGEAWKTKRKETLLKRENATNRAYWLLWQFFNEVCARLAQVAVAADFVDGRLWLYATHAGTKLFGGDRLDYPEIYVNVRPSRDACLSSLSERAHIPPRMNFSSPGTGFGVRLLLDEIDQEGGMTGLMLADINTSSAEELLYVKALALHIPTIKGALGTHLPTIDPPPETGPTGDLEWVCW